MVSIEHDGSIVFAVECPWASTVEVVGAFEGWHEQRHSMRLDDDGLWRIRLDLKPGEYLFRYLVDGRLWALDAEAHGIRQALGGNRMSRVWRPPGPYDSNSRAA
jgi:1,4-alpha-glucan branching enzyme